MKANKKTLNAVKIYLTEESEYWDRDAIVDEIAEETKLIKVKGIGNVAMDECSINWGEDEICNLSDFVNTYFDIMIEKICNILNSFIGEDIDYYSDYES